MKYYSAILKKKEREREREREREKEKERKGKERKGRHPPLHSLAYLSDQHKKGSPGDLPTLHNA